MNRDVRPDVVALLSGGLDSSANCFEAVLDGRVGLALTVDYGQRSSGAEIRAAEEMARRWGVKHEVVRIPWLGALGGSALTDSPQLASRVPEYAAERLDDRQTALASARAVWVPNRNGVLIHLAAAYAERLGMSRVLVGFNREEAATFPDNSAAYLEAVSQALAFSTANAVKVECYTTELDKTQIVRRVVELSRSRAKPFPWELIWSCYEAGPEVCGKCESCRRLERARLFLNPKETHA